MLEGDASSWLLHLECTIAHMSNSITESSNQSLCMIVKCLDTQSDKHGMVTSQKRTGRGIDNIMSQTNHKSVVFSKRRCFIGLKLFLLKLEGFPRPAARGIPR